MKIPEELKELKQWVCASKDSKAPMKAFAREPASSTNPATWSDFSTAFKVVEKGIYDNIGFVFNDNGYVGIDIDAGYDEYGLMTPLAADIIGICESYTEKSRSGRGFHILLKGSLPFKGKNNLQGVEIYKASRYFILTGDVVLYPDIVENQDAINYVLDKYFKNSLRDSNKPILQKKIYTPIWENPIHGNTIALRPKYPPIPQGCRNISLTSLAGAMHSLGYAKDNIYRELEYVNKNVCDPPLDFNELNNIIDSIVRYTR